MNRQPEPLPCAYTGVGLRASDRSPEKEISMINITYEQLVDTLRTLGYPVWVKPYDLNAFGIRNPSRVPNKFDDTIGIAYTDCDNRKRILLCPATTDPGLDYLLNPMSNKGTAIMCEGCVIVENVVYPETNGGEE